MDFINMFSLKGKNALVTGASYGIGFEIAKALSNAGATIIFNDVIEENIKKGLHIKRTTSTHMVIYLILRMNSL
jgi:gluconate 5-dehydrogenase